MNEENVLELKRKPTVGINVMVKAFYRASPNEPMIYYRALNWIAKDEIAEVFQNAPNTDTKSILVFKNGKKSVECYEDVPTVARKIES